MVDCVGGFPHGGVISNIGGFLTDPPPSPSAGSQDLTDPGIFLAGDGPWGYPIIGGFGTADLKWAGSAEPPVGSSYFEFDLYPMYEASYFYNSVYQYRPADGHPWITANGVDYGLLFLIKKDVGDLVFWLTRRFSEEPGLDALIDGDEVDMVYLEARIDTAVAAGRAIVAPAVLVGGLRYKVSVAIDRANDTDVSFTLALTEDDYSEQRELGPFGTVSLADVTYFGGFDDSYLWHPRDPYSNNIGQPRLLVPGTCPLAPTTPAFTPRVLELDTPGACDTGMTSPDEDYSGPYLPNFKVTAPIGDTPEKFTVTIESVCDKPMSLSGIEWTGWIFNNSRRI